jgi:hypothetical protein
MEQMALHEISRSREGTRTVEAREAQLLTLVGELLQTNQELRFKVADLERQVKSADCALDKANRWSGFLLP